MSCWAKVATVASRLTGSVLLNRSRRAYAGGAELILDLILIPRTPAANGQAPRFGSSCLGQSVNGDTVAIR
jgi:hypothetical protein